MGYDAVVKGEKLEPPPVDVEDEPLADAGEEIGRQILEAKEEVPPEETPPLSELDELEPLFNYPRVLPVDLLSFQDNAFDCSPIMAQAKRRKISNINDDSANEVGLDDSREVKESDRGACIEDDGEAKESNQKVCFEDDEDWLALPPPKVCDSRVGLKENETLQQLRLQKQILISITQSAEDILQQMVESTKKDLNAAKESATTIVLDQPSKPQVERLKVIVSIQDKYGQKQFRMYSDDKFEKLFKMYAEKVQLMIENLVFTFDGDKVSPTSTPEVLGMENEDIIEVHERS